MLVIRFELCTGFNALISAKDGGSISALLCVTKAVPMQRSYCGRQPNDIQSCEYGSAPLFSAAMCSVACRKVEILFPYPARMASFCPYRPRVWVSQNKVGENGLSIPSASRREKRSERTKNLLPPQTSVCGYVSRSKCVMIPKLLPPPRRAQKRSGLVFGLAFVIEPLVRTIRF